MRTRSVLVAVGAVGTVLLALGQSRDGGPRGQVARHRGFVTPSLQVELVAALEEVLAEVVVAEGDRVEKGQLLARLDDRLQTVVVESAHVRAESRAALRRSELDLERATIDLERTQEASGRGAASDIELRRARIAKGQAEAELEREQENVTLAGVNLRLEQRRLDRYQVRAPFDATVVRILVDPGTMLTETDAIVRLAHLETLEAQINLPVELYGRLTEGQSYRLAGSSPVDRNVTGRLVLASPMIDPASQTFRCVFTIDNADLALPAGFTVYLEWPQG